MRKSKLKIAIVGTHSTGKTSIVEFLKNHYKRGRIHIIKEVARDLINKGYKLGKGGTQNVYFKYFDERLKREIEAKQNGFDLLISDRSLVDEIAYPIINERLGITSVSKDFLNLLEHILFFQKSFYDAYIYIPICFNNVDDGVRDSEEDYRKEADLEIKQLLNKHIDSYYQLKCGTVNDMGKQVVEIIENLRKE